MLILKLNYGILALVERWWIMRNLAVLTALNCHSPTIKNSSSFPLNPRDYEVLSIAQTRCIVHFPELPCVGKFEKVGEHAYRVLCRAAKKGVNKNGQSK